MQANRWDQFATGDQGILNHLSVGINYLDVCRRAASLDDGNAKEALDGIENVLAGKLPSFSMEYPYDAGEGARWFAMQVDPMPRDHGGVVISHADITERKQADEALRNALNEVRQLKEQLEVENIYLREEVSEVHRFGEIGGRSESISKALRHAELVAPTDATVLITGETGTGKELLARAVHARSKRSHRPLVKVNCAGLPASLIESELFGHEKGAFTGASSKRIGRFELANEATIFLDEVGELPLELQAKLLRVLQEGEFERLGSSKTIKVNARVIAATNRDLGQAVKNGMFRDDLYYRLNVYPINLPPLRDRKEDIPELVQTFLSEASRRLGRSFNRVPPRIVEGLMKYDWPGNVRELENVVERMAVTAKGSQLTLPADWLSDSPTPVAYEVLNSQRLNSAVASQAETTVESIERAHILRILEQRRWRIEGPHGAAVVLGPQTQYIAFAHAEIAYRSIVRRREVSLSYRPAGGRTHPAIKHNSRPLRVGCSAGNLPNYASQLACRYPDSPHDIQRFPHYLAGLQSLVDPEYFLKPSRSP